MAESTTKKFPVILGILLLFGIIAIFISTNNTEFFSDNYEISSTGSASELLIQPTISDESFFDEQYNIEQFNTVATTDIVGDPPIISPGGETHNIHSITHSLGSLTHYTNSDSHLISTTVHDSQTSNGHNVSTTFHIDSSLTHQSDSDLHSVPSNIGEIFCCFVFR